MKIRVTLMTENDKHPDESSTDEAIVKAATIGWNALLAMLSKTNDKAVVENIELVER